MNPINALLEALATGLGIWRDERATQFERERLGLEQEWMNERKKEFIDMDRLDSIEQRLFLLSRKFAAAASRGGSALGPVH